MAISYLQSSVVGLCARLGRLAGQETEAMHSTTESKVSEKNVTDVSMYITYLIHAIEIFTKNLYKSIVY